MFEETDSRVGGFAGLRRDVLRSVWPWQPLDARALGDFTGIAHPPRLQYSHHRFSAFTLCVMNVLRSFQLPASDICTFTALLRPASWRPAMAREMLTSTRRPTQHPLLGILTPCAPSENPLAPLRAFMDLRHVRIPSGCSLREAAEGGKEGHRATWRRNRGQNSQSRNRRPGRSSCSAASVAACRYTAEAATTPPLSHRQRQQQIEHEAKTVHEHSENDIHPIVNKEPDRYPRSLVRRFASSNKELPAELPNLDSRKTKTS